MRYRRRSLPSWRRRNREYPLLTPDPRVVPQIMNPRGVFHKKDFIYPDDNDDGGDKVTNTMYKEYIELREYDRLPQLPADS